MIRQNENKQEVPVMAVLLWIDLLLFKLPQMVS